MKTSPNDQTDTSLNWDEFFIIPNAVTETASGESITEAEYMTALQFQIKAWLLEFKPKETNDSE